MIPGNATATVEAGRRIASLLTDGEHVVSVEPAGESNMNWVRRIRTNRRSLIVKLANPWVEKYPHIPAPVSRSAIEAAFLRTAAVVPELGARLPALIAFEDGLLVLEDLGGSGNLGGVYRGGTPVDRADLEILAGFLGHLRSLRIPNPDAFRNDAMRELNHEHIFALPLAGDPGLLARLDEITPGLAGVALRLSRKPSLVRKVRDLGGRYLRKNSETLIHGDFFFGSFLRDAAGDLRVIDPEFSFCGDPEFDAGVLLAHLHLAGLGNDMALCWTRLVNPDDPALMQAFAGVEIIRRLLGVAQLPGSHSLAEKCGLLERAGSMIAV